ncbi:MAG TPA: hypothetical protein VFV63_21995 [Ilumatobacteraceae bacterium]|nr:hypothetical protein [Ilumatobacteraceae bacterium]
MTDDLSRRLVELERELADVRAQLEQVADSAPLSSRRNLLRVATAAAVGAAGAGLASRSAEAATGGNAILGQENTADAVTGIHNTSDPFAAPAGDGPIALRLTSAGGHLQFVGTPGDTVFGSYPSGTLAYNSTSGLEIWQPSLGPDPRPTLLARPGTAGALTLLLEPVRVYDSRPGATPDLPNDGRIATGDVRTIDLLASGAEGFIENIDGVMMNLTVTDTLGFGFLTVFSADIAATPNVSSINWFDNGMSVANHVVSAVDLAQLKVACGGGGSTHFIIDVIGVYG